MAYGISTYAYFWRISERAPKPLSLLDMLVDTNQLGGRVFQICDYPPIESYDAARLADVRDAARDLGLTLELGTRGVRPGHLAKYLDIAGQLDVTLVRSMMNTADHRPTVEEATTLLRQALPACTEAGVTLGLETYEQVSTDDLVTVVENVGSRRLGVVLDPGNSVARLERPVDVVEATAPYVVNVHVKDFAFTRRDGWVGFTYAGCPLGTGLLDYAAMTAAVRPHERGINQIVEHWLPWQDDGFDTTARLEDQWTRHSISTLSSNTLLRSE
ncbi:MULTISPECIES: TIM barrel protein [unclassified Streptomyces]|uniref:sugar phosphate isomerase/epimerase family protein n=1 Tax=unclassified Streptomyces TaxID=2593676 RepID=UPI002DDA57B2|nr:MULTISPECIES: TIM barrel protein [unclassified Streptomyces]WSA90678.1 sugar phosphate isomerase/epimerase [Streptomyces sp. NBC_01795]WSB75003.1 sugar phosphate isomerase/epimerase [Streptomyces sp. NBC_01775]WSS16718.1 sugar phosphate isomerase/epimerase [Streptomyces sp. NBC_01186]WSS45536.1 sugar phosphate isomerase/epimerase [Streptomyces sp. NBC_01187]